MEENINYVQGNPPTPVKEDFKSLGISGLFKRAWIVYKKRFWTLMGIMIIPIIITIGLAMITSMNMGMLLLLTWRGLPKNPTHLNWVSILFFALLSFVVQLVIYAWTQLSLIYAIRAWKEKLGIGKALKKGFSKILSAIWIHLLLIILLLISVVPGTLLYILTLISGIEILWILALISYVIFPMIIIIYFSFSVYALAEENKGGIKALNRSKELVKRNWWRIFWRILLLSIISAIISLLLGFIPKVGEALANVLITPFLITFIYFVYKDLKEEKGEALQQTPQEINISGE